MTELYLKVTDLKNRIKEADTCADCKNPRYHLDNSAHFHDVKLLLEYIEELEITIIDEGMYLPHEKYSNN